MNNITSLSLNIHTLATGSTASVGFTTGQACFLVSLKLDFSSGFQLAGEGGDCTTYLYPLDISWVVRLAADVAIKPQITFT